MKKIVLIVIVFLALHTVNAQNVNIPDATLKAILVNNPYINGDMDGEIQVEEAKLWTGSIKVNDNQNIADMTGIEAFINLEILELKNTSVTSLDISTLVALKTLFIDGCQITSLDVSKNTKLERLSTTGCAIADFNLSANTSLKNLYARFNPITSLTLPTSNSLTYIQLDGGTVTKLDLSTYPNLVYVYLQNLPLVELNLANGKNNKITEANFRLSGTGTSLTCIQVSDTFYTSRNWTVEKGVSFSTDCGYQSSASIKEVAKAVKVYPNPATNRLSIADLQGQAEVSIHNLLGKEVLQTNAAQNIDISTLPQGVYTVRISQNGVISQAKFIKN